MKLKAVFLSALLVGALSLTGCDWQNVESAADSDAPSNFVKVEEAAGWDIVYDKDTRVMYAVSSGGYNFGNFTLLVNPDGTPKLYEED